MDVGIKNIKGLSAGDTAGLIASQRKLGALIRLLTHGDQEAFLSLGDLQADALMAVRDYADQIGEILEHSQDNPNSG